MIHEWSIPQGVGFYNIEFDLQGTTLGISDTAGFGSGGSVYRFFVREDRRFPAKGTRKEHSLGSGTTIPIHSASVTDILPVPT
jgi:hypothetical protein